MAGTHVITDALFKISVEHVSLKDEMDRLLKEWQESTERYHAAGGSDDMNGNLQQQSAQAKQDTDTHGKATGDRTQRTADTSKEAAEEYSGTDGDNGMKITKIGDSVIDVQPAGGGSKSGGSDPAKTNFNAPATTQGGPVAV